MNKKRLLNESETAVYISMSRQFLRKSRMNGVLPGHTVAPPFVKIGRSIRYCIHDLDSWIDANRRPVPGGCDHAHNADR